jgi:uncharacterized protein YbgA (DUF1722 family)/uncharacterized protein YbbK (DUF523 family)
MLKIAVSSCLIGNRVRFDGGAKTFKFLLDDLSEFVEFIPFCPENSLFGSPRESIRIVSKDGNKRAIGNKSELDLTEKLVDESQKVAKSFLDSGISGVIFKSKSPTCAIASVKNYLPNGFIEGKTSGLLFDEFQKEFPLLPMEEEGRLEDVWLRENFIMQIFAFDDMLELVKNAKKFNELVEFHTSYKFLLHAKNEVLYREMGNIVANREKIELSQILESYSKLFFKAISQKSSVERNINILQHMFGFVKKSVTPEEKEEFLQNLEDYKNRLVPIIVPISFLQLFAKEYKVEYLLNQKFLSPYPKKLALRSKITER